MNRLRQGGRRIGSLFAILALTLVASLTMTTAAYAVDPNGPDQINFSQGVGFQDWRTSDGYLYGQSMPTNMVWGDCIDVLFDWKIEVPAWKFWESKHHDPRVTRACVNNNWITLTRKDTTPYRTGLQKGGSCIGPNNATNTQGACWAFTASGSSGELSAIKAYPSTCSMLRTGDYDGVIRYYSGGDPRSCTS